MSHTSESSYLLLAQILIDLSKFQKKYCADSSLFVSDVKTSSAQRIINYIDANYTTLQNVSQIAECCGVSESYIHRIIKKNTSVTVKEYINKLRLRHAIHEMDCSNNSFAIISKACGFQNISYFYYLFKKNYGLTPTEYREQLKKTHK